MVWFSLLCHAEVRGDPRPKGKIEIWEYWGQFEDEKVEFKSSARWNYKANMETPEILDAVIEIMELEQLLKSNCQVEVLPDNANFLIQLGESPTPRPPRLRQNE